MNYDVAHKLAEAIHEIVYVAAFEASTKTYQVEMRMKTTLTLAVCLQEFAEELKK